MSNQRIEIIIQEINHWKEHKLLPEVYCDFLLALYTNGENEAEHTDVKSIGWVSILQFSSQFLLLLLSIIVINMQHINLVFQAFFLPMSFLVIFWLFKTLNKKSNIFSHLSAVIPLVHFLLITIFLANQWSSNQWVINIIIICNFIGWFVIGRKYQLRYLPLISVILAMFTIIYMFF